jgi:tetratricopeptide (TPR) repeat protein
MIAAVLAALAALTLAAASPAQRREARSLLVRSIKEYDLAQFEAALADIQRAYLLDPQPELLFNVGQCERALHHWELAKTAYERYLREKPRAPNRQLVENRIAEMSARLAEARLEAKPAPAPAPAPIQPILVEAPPAPVVVAAPAVSAPAPAKHRSHALAWTLGSVGLAAGLVAAFGGYEVASYDNLASQANASRGAVSADGLVPALQNANTWQPIAIALAVVAAVGVGGAFLTW